MRPRGVRHRRRPLDTPPVPLARDCAREPSLPLEPFRSVRAIPRRAVAVLGARTPAYGGTCSFHNELTSKAPPQSDSAAVGARATCRT